ARVNLVLAMLRARQMWGGQQEALPGLREALGMAEDGSASRGDTDETEARAHALVESMEQHGWTADAADKACTEVLDAAADPAPVQQVLEFARREVVPRLESTTDEITATLHALGGGFIP